MMRTLDSTRSDLTAKSLTELADSMAAGQPGSQRDHEAQAEFLRRQTLFQQEASQAARATAASTSEYTKYMFWSVVVLAVSAFLSVVLDILRFMSE
jgi:hypothetical protein